MALTAHEFKTLIYSRCAADLERAVDEPASTEVWDEVLDLWPFMAVWVARNTRLPSATQQRLLTEGSVAVRCVLATKGGHDHAGWLRLAADPWTVVRLRVACNAEVPDDVVQSLMDDPSVVVREAARRRRLDSMESEQDARRWRARQPVRTTAGD